MKRKQPVPFELWAFTLIEVLVSIVVLSLLGGAGYVAVSESRNAARESKLNSDVAALNAAIPLYESSGGSLEGITDPEVVIEKLQTVATEDSATAIIGATRSFIDRRLAPVSQSEADATAGRLRAIWDSDARRFILANEGAGGIGEFRIDEARGAADPATEARETALQFAKTDTWVWDYEDTDPASGSPGGVTPGLSGSPALTGADPAETDILAVPGFHPAGGTSALVDFDLNVTLSNPNPPGTSQIFFSVDEGTYALYRGETLVAAPGSQINAFAATIDPDRWANSEPRQEEYDPIPVRPLVAVSVPFNQATYALMGGEITGLVTQTPPPATLTITNLAEIPERFQSSGYFQVYFTMDGSDPITSETALEGPSFSNGFNPVSVPLSLEAWPAGNEVLLIRAGARARSPFFLDSTPAQGQIAKVRTQITPAPSISPSSGALPPDTDVEILLALGQPYPANSRIFYTLNGNDPGNNGTGNPQVGNLYTSPVSTGGVMPAIIQARIYGPSGYESWFDPSGLSTATYSGPFFGEGAFVGSAQLYSTFVGNLIYAPPRAGQNMQNIQFYGNSRIANGNLYLPGTPKIYRDWVGATQEWLPNVTRDNQFANYIAGRHFLPSGEEVIPATVPPYPRVVDEGQVLVPTNYYLVMYSGAKIDGKIFRQNDIPPFPTISQPPPKDNNNTMDYGSYRLPPNPLSSTNFANVTLNSGLVQARLLPGNYGLLTANNGTAFVVGDPLNPDVVQVYNIEELRLNSASDLIVVGKAIINLTKRVEINNGSVIGNPSNPGWLQMNFFSGDFAANSGSSAYTQIVAPNSSVYLNNGSIFVGSVTANYMQITSQSVVFSLPPIIEQ